MACAESGSIQLSRSEVEKSLLMTSQLQTDFLIIARMAQLQYHDLFLCHTVDALPPKSSLLLL